MNDDAKELLLGALRSLAEGINALPGIEALDGPTLAEIRHALVTMADVIPVE